MPRGNPLTGLRVVNTSVNLPAHVAAARLMDLGATVTKVEPPDGDPTSLAVPGLYEELTEGQDVVRLDLTSPAGQGQLDGLLATTDVLLTSTRPSALERMGLGQPALGERHPRLVHVAIVGHAAPEQERPGHDLTYAAPHGLVAPPILPRTLMIDLTGAERSVSTALALLHAREQGSQADRYAEVPLEDAASYLALPLRHGVTGEGGILGGVDPYYGCYEARDGWVALAALEPKFRQRVVAELGREPGTPEFAAALLERTALEWERWADERDIPLVAVGSARIDRGA